jgi:signal transduction histidine kinase
MTAQLDELVGFVRLQEGHAVSLDRQPTDCVALARRVIAAHLLVTDQHDLRFDATETEIAGCWDPVRIERVLEHLLSSAVKNSPAGGTVTVRRWVEHGTAARSQ